MEASRVWLEARPILINALELAPNGVEERHMTLIVRLRIILNDVDPQPMR